MNNQELIDKDLNEYGLHHIKSSSKQWEFMLSEHFYVNSQLLDMGSSPELKKCIQDFFYLTEREATYCFLSTTGRYKINTMSWN
jgi:hypothetical protein